MSRVRVAFNTDTWLLLLVFSLSTIGLLMVASASMAVSDHQFGTPFHFLLHQLIYFVIAVAGAMLIRYVPLGVWESVSRTLLLICMGMLLLVLVPGVGREINGSMRWLGVGPIGVQVSEFVKLGVVIFMASYIARREDEISHTFSGFVKPLLLLGVIAALLLLEPDFGAMSVIIMMALGMLFLAGVRLWQFALLFSGVAGAIAMLAISSPYRLQRLTTFLDPWSAQFQGGYQLTQSLMAFGRGGVWGVGLGNSLQKMFYLPEAHTDFLFAIYAEEFGLIGELVVLALFTLLVAHAFKLAQKALQLELRFAAYLAYGAGFWLAFHALINIGVNAGVLPTKGLTLPFMSYGGSSMIVNWLLVGLLMRVHHEILRHR